MADTPKPVAQQTYAKNAANAPVIYFDQAPSYAAAGNIFAIELTAAMVLPTRGDRPFVDTIMTAHLRGTVEAMLALRAAIDGCMAMHEQAAEGRKLAS